MLIARKTQGLLLCMLISILLLSALYTKPFFNPNTYLFADEGDGIKTYYNYAWHIKHDRTFTQFEGMSYPYGEAMAMEDTLPLFSTTLKLISYIFPPINDYCIGILNFLILFSIVIGAAFLYLILLSFNLPIPLSITAANAICFLSSQILLLKIPAGHYGLSFACFFPMGWYFLIRFFRDNNKTTWSVIIALNILIWNYSHVYLGLILLMFTFFTHFFKIIFNPISVLKNLKNYIFFFIQICIPIIIILSVIKLTDHHNDRINMPPMIDYRASFYSVFMPVMSPLKPIYEFLFNLSEQQNQSWCLIGNYIGVSSNIALIFFIVIAVINGTRHRVNRIKFFAFNGGVVYVLASIVLLMYSMAIHFRIIPLKILNLFPLIKQFLGLGRFAWAFYYVIAIFSIVFFYELLFKNLIGKVLVYLLVGLYFFEGISYHVTVSKAISKALNPFNKNYLSADKKILALIDAHCFQAIMPIPNYFYFNLPFGQGKYDIDKSIYSSMVASYHSGLPIISTYLSRPSVSESMNIFKQYMPYPYQQNIPEMLLKKKDILVLATIAYENRFDENERNVIDRSERIKGNKQYALYNLCVDDLVRSDLNERSKKFEAITNSLIPYKGHLVLDTTKYFFTNSFDSTYSNEGLKGMGACVGLKKGNNIICNISTDRMDTTKEYSISFWYYNYIWDQTFNTAILTERDSTGKILQEIYYSPIDAKIIDEWWYLSERTIKIKSNSSRLILSFSGEKKFENWFSVDELLIRPVDLDVWKVIRNDSMDWVYLNNKRWCEWSKHKN